MLPQCPRKREAERIDTGETTGPRRWRPGCPRVPVAPEAGPSPRAFGKRRQPAVLLLGDRDRDSPLEPPLRGSIPRTFLNRPSGERWVWAAAPGTVLPTRRAPVGASLGCPASGPGRAEGTGARLWDSPASCPCRTATSQHLLPATHIPRTVSPGMPLASATHTTGQEPKGATQKGSCHLQMEWTNWGP